MALSKRERDRLVILRQVQEGKLRQKAAPQQLKLSVRWVKKLVKRLREQGDGGLAHALRGRVSNRAHDSTLRRQALALIRQHYDDYGPTLASELLLREHAIAVNRETLRQWMSQEKLWKPRREKLHQVHLWRPRRRRRGELVQWDSSDQDWLEGRGPRLMLIAMIDDATSELTARFALSDSTAENMRLLWSYLERYGRPLEYYTDKASLFQINRPLHHNKHLEAKPPPTQIERALEELGIGRITAHSPQAKGRIERSFGTLQDRLVKALRRAGANTLEQANRCLQEEFLQEWEQFRRPAAQVGDAHRALRKDQDLGSILSHVERRVVTNDYTVAWHGQRYQIPAAEAKPRMRKAAVRIEQRLNGELWMRWKQGDVRLSECRPAQRVEAPGATQPVVAPAGKAAPRKPPAAKRKSRWMDGFVLRGKAKKGGLLPATPAALRATSVAGNSP